MLYFPECENIPRECAKNSRICPPSSYIYVCMCMCVCVCGGASATATVSVPWRRARPNTCLKIEHREQKKPPRMLLSSSSSLDPEP
eukprot:310985-Chlamydomonas_euryale.AAC.1